MAINLVTPQPTYYGTNHKQYTTKQQQSWHQQHLVDEEVDRRRPR